jgi:hypothetical protein
MLGTSNSLKSQDLERRYEFSEGAQQRISAQQRIRERMEEFERRLAKVEEKLDC